MATANSDWPRCPAKVILLGEWTLDCTRPKGHEFDGVEMHKASLEGTEWSMMVTRHGDGETEPRPCGER